MRTNWLRFGVLGVLFAVACSEDMENPFADASLSAGGDGDGASVGASSDSTGAETTGDDSPETTGAGSTSSESDDGSSTSAAETGPSNEAGSDEGHDDGESSTTAGAIACIDHGECQPCVDCTVLPGGECQDEALACQGDGDCNALAACYNACAMMFMGDELEACIDTCYVDYPDAVTAFEAAYGCFIDECGDLCPTEFGPLGD